MQVKLSGRATTIPVGLAYGAMISTIVTTMISAIGAHLVTHELIPQEHIGYCSITALLLATISGALVASGKTKRRKFFVSIISGLIYFCILLGITALFFGGQYKGIGVTFLTVLLGTMAAAILSSRDRKHDRGNKHKKRSR